MKKLFKAFKKGQKGFTLIELLVVIAIIAVLAAIIVPNVGKYIGSGQTAANSAELKMVKNAVAAAMADARVADLSALPAGFTTTWTAAIVIHGGATPVDFSITRTAPAKTWNVKDYFSDPDVDLASLVQGYLTTKDGAVTVTAVP